MVKSSKPKPPKPARLPKRKRPSKKRQTAFPLSLPAVQLPESETKKPEKPTPKPAKAPPGEREAARARVMRALADDIETHAEPGAGDP